MKQNEVSTLKVWALMEGGNDEPIQVRLMSRQERNEEQRKADEATDGTYGWVEYRDPRIAELTAKVRDFRNAIDSINTMSGRCSTGHGNECECGYCLIHRIAFNAWKHA